MHRMLFVVWIYHPLHDMPGICYIAIFTKPQLLTTSVRDYDDSLGFVNWQWQLFAVNLSHRH